MLVPRQEHVDVGTTLGTEARDEPAPSVLLNREGILSYMPRNVGTGERKEGRIVARTRASAIAAKTGEETPTTRGGGGGGQRVNR